MIASRMLNAGVSKADIQALWFVRNSAIRHTPMYAKIRQRIRVQMGICGVRSTS